MICGNLILAGQSNGECALLVSLGRRCCIELVHRVLNGSFAASALEIFIRTHVFVKMVYKIVCSSRELMTLFLIQDSCGKRLCECALMYRNKFRY